MITRKTFAAALYLAGTKIFPTTLEQSPPVETQTEPSCPKMERGGELNHTLGPWFPSQNKAGAWRVQMSAESDSRILFWAGPDCREYLQGDSEASARLAAAAPEMLERLEFCLEFLTSVCLRLDPANYLRVVDEVSELRTLIEKATGVAK